MQIDVHHAAIYVAARIAGFSHDEAAIIAYAAQYTDDAIYSGIIAFDNGAHYSRIASSREAVRFSTLDPADICLVWPAFHFLPGNGGRKTGVDPTGTFIEKLICQPGDRSYIAQDMVRAALRERNRPNGLFRLGITLHVYADTWSHQGFAGVLHDVNNVTRLDALSHPDVFPPETITNLLSRAIPPLGHGKAQVFCDMPFLRWSYRNARGDEVTRDNTSDFCAAINASCKVMQRYRRRTAVGISGPDAAKIEELFTTLVERDGNQRHALWIEAIAQGVFSFGPAVTGYDAKGPKSWKADALGTGADLPTYPYRPEFLQSKWKLFHDALQQHRLAVLHEILPQYGICAA